MSQTTAGEPLQLGMSKEQKQEAQDKFLRKMKKIYANGIFEIKVPIDPKDVPEEELKLLKDERIS